MDEATLLAALDDLGVDTYMALHARASLGRRLEIRRRWEDIAFSTPSDLLDRVSLPRHDQALGDLDRTVSEPGWWPPQVNITGSDEIIDMAEKRAKADVQAIEDAAAVASLAPKEPMDDIDAAHKAKANDLTHATSVLMQRPPNRTQIDELTRLWKEWTQWVCRPHVTTQRAWDSCPTPYLTTIRQVAARLAVVERQQWHQQALTSATGPSGTYWLMELHDLQTTAWERLRRTLAAGTSPNQVIGMILSPEEHVLVVRLMQAQDSAFKANVFTTASMAEKGAGRSWVQSLPTLAAREFRTRLEQAIEEGRGPGPGTVQQMVDGRLQWVKPDDRMAKTGDQVMAATREPEYAAVHNEAALLEQWRALVAGKKKDENPVNLTTEMPIAALQIKKESTMAQDVECETVAKAMADTGLPFDEVTSKKDTAWGRYTGDEKQAMLDRATTRWGAAVAKNIETYGPPRSETTLGFLPVLASGTSYLIQEKGDQESVQSYMRSWRAFAHDLTGNPNVGTKQFQSLLSTDQADALAALVTRAALDDTGQQLVMRDLDLVSARSVVSEWAQVREGLGWSSTTEGHTQFREYLSDEQRQAYDKHLQGALNEELRGWVNSLKSPSLSMDAIRQAVQDLAMGLRGWALHRDPTGTTEVPLVEPATYHAVANLCRLVWLKRTEDIYATPSQAELNAAVRICQLLVLHPNKDPHQIIDGEKAALNLRAEKKAALVPLLTRTEQLVQAGCPMPETKVMLAKWDAIRASMPQEQWADIATLDLLMPMRRASGGARPLGPAIQGGTLTSLPEKEAMAIEQEKLALDALSSFGDDHRGIYEQLMAYEQAHGSNQESDMPMQTDTGKKSETAEKGSYKEAADEGPDKGVSGQMPMSRSQRLGVTLTNDARDAAWRTGAKQFVKLVQEPTAALVGRHLGPDDEALRRKIADFLATEAGGALLASVLSMGLMAMPEATLGQGVAPRLARELRVKAMTDMGDIVADVLMGPLRQVMSLYLQGVPTGDEPPHQLTAAPPSGLEHNLYQAEHTKAE